MHQTPSQQPSSAARSTSGELRSDARQIGSKAADRLHSEVDARKDTAATQAKSVSNAIQSAAGQLDDAPSWVRSAFQQGAEQIQHFAEALERKDSRQLVSDVQSFARERPALFLGACAAAGFAASRVFKAGGDQESSEQFGSTEWSRSQPWGDGGNYSGRIDNREESIGTGSQDRPFMASGDGDGQPSARRQTATFGDGR